MVKKRGCEEASAVVRRGAKRFFQFSALLVTHSFLRRRQIRQRGAPRDVPSNVTALAALFICLFKFKVFDVVF